MTTQQIHVLLVEDNAADVDLTRETLDLVKFDGKLSVARDGVEAIEFLNGAGSWDRPGHPTLILLDLNLPRKDGRQVLAVLKSDDLFRRIPVVILSSSDSEKDITSCYNLGANCYIVKPVDLQAYRDIVRALEDFWLVAAKLPRHDGHSNASGIGYEQ
jgi:two-component system, chemotaxis family, response regulator Rcp1